MRITQLAFLLPLLALPVYAIGDDEVDVVQDAIDNHEHPVLVKGGPQYKDTDFKIQDGTVIPEDGKGTSTFIGLSSYADGRPDWRTKTDDERIKKANKESFQPLTKARVERQKSVGGSPILTLKADGGVGGNPDGHVSITPTKPRPVAVVEAAVSDLRQEGGANVPLQKGSKLRDEDTAREAARLQLSQQAQDQPSTSQASSSQPPAAGAPQSQSGSATPPPAQPATGEITGNGCLTKRDGSTSCPMRSKSAADKSLPATASKQKTPAIKQADRKKSSTRDADKNSDVQAAARQKSLKDNKKAKSPKTPKAGRPNAARKNAAAKKGDRKASPAGPRGASKKKSGAAAATPASRKQAAKSKPRKAVGGKAKKAGGGAVRPKGQAPKSKKRPSAIKKQPGSKKAAARPKKAAASRKKPAASKKQKAKPATRKAAPRKAGGRAAAKKGSARKAPVAKIAPVNKKGKRIGRRDLTMMNRPRMVYEALYERDLVDLE